MPRPSLLKPATLCLPLLASPAWADVTAEQVWADWKAYMGSFGYELTATESQSGDALTVSDAAITIAFPEGEMKMTLPQMVFTNTGSGAVLIELPERMPINFAIDPEDGESVSSEIVITQSAPNMIVSGDPDDMTYTHSADTMGMVMNGITVGGVTLGEENFRFDMQMNDVHTVARMQITDLRQISQTMTVASMTYNGAFADPEGEGTMEFTGEVTGLDFEGAGQVPQLENYDPMNPSLIFKAGMAFSGTYSAEAFSGQMRANTPDGPMESTASGGASSLSAEMSVDGITYEARQEATSMTMQVPGLPFPLSLDAQRASTNVLFPLQKSDDPQDFAFGIGLEEFTLSDGIWALFDSAAQLPRDPATLVLDLTGTTKLLVDFFDPAQTAAMEPDAAPGELLSLDIRNLLLRAVGVEVTGNGAFEFDNTDMISFDGMPRPEGKMSLQLAGANGLLDKLVAMGFVPDEQAMGMRMMMGLFAVPGDAPDTLTSVVEINAEGHVLANGQRIR